MMRLTIRFWGLFSAAALFFCPNAAVTGAAPRIGASSVWTDGPTMLYGAGMDGEIEYFVHGEPVHWDDTEVQASLRRVLNGTPDAFRIPDDARWNRVVSRDPYAVQVNLYTRATRGSEPRHVYLRNEQGLSEPYTVNRPEVWGASPVRARPGQTLIVWGVNLGRRYGLVEIESEEMSVTGAGSKTPKAFSGAGVGCLTAL